MFGNVSETKAVSLKEVKDSIVGYCRNGTWEWSANVQIISILCKRPILGKVFRES